MLISWSSIEQVASVWRFENAIIFWDITGEAVENKRSFGRMCSLDGGIWVISEVEKIYYLYILEIYACSFCLSISRGRCVLLPITQANEATMGMSLVFYYIVTFTLSNCCTAGPTSPFKLQSELWLMELYGHLKEKILEEFSCLSSLIYPLWSYFGQ